MVFGKEEDRGTVRSCYRCVIVMWSHHTMATFVTLLRLCLPASSPAVWLFLPLLVPWDSSHWVHPTFQMQDKGATPEGWTSSSSLEILLQGRVIFSPPSVYLFNLLFISVGTHPYLFHNQGCDPLSGISCFSSCSNILLMVFTWLCPSFHWNPLGLFSCPQIRFLLLLFGMGRALLGWYSVFPDWWIWSQPPS